MGYKMKKPTFFSSALKHSKSGSHNKQFGPGHGWTAKSKGPEPKATHEAPGPGSQTEQPTEKYTPAGKKYSPLEQVDEAKEQVDEAKKIVRNNVGNTTVDAPKIFDDKHFDEAEKNMMKAVEILRNSGFSEGEIEQATGAGGYKAAMDWAKKKDSPNKQKKYHPMEAIKEVDTKSTGYSNQDKSKMKTEKEIYLAKLLGNYIDLRGVSAKDYEKEILKQDPNFKFPRWIDKSDVSKKKDSSSPLEQNNKFEKWEKDSKEATESLNKRADVLKSVKTKKRTKKQKKQDEGTFRGNNPKHIRDIIKKLEEKTNKPTDRIVAEMVKKGFIPTQLADMMAIAKGGVVGKVSLDDAIKKSEAKQQKADTWPDGTKKTKRDKFNDRETTEEIRKETQQKETQETWEPAYEGGDHSWKGLENMSTAKLKLNFPEDWENIQKDLLKRK